MKNKGVILTFISLFSLLFSSCDHVSSLNQISEKSETIVSSSLSNPASNSGTDHTANQPLYNRIILDYHEQRIKNKKTLGNDMYSLNRTSLNLNDISLDDVQLDFIISKTNSGACFVGVNNSIQTFGDMFYYAFNDYSVACQIRIPDVWYQGKFYYLTDAFYQGLINELEVQECLKKTANVYVYKESFIVKPADKIKYNKSVEPLNISGDIIDDSSILFQMRKTLFEQEIKNNSDYDSYHVEKDDIHIFQSFGMFNNAYCVNFSIDGVNPPRYIYNVASKEWSEDFVFEDIAIKAFQDFVPTVYVNQQFYPIDEAYSNRIIDKETAIELLRQYRISSKQNNCDNYVW